MDILSVLFFLDIFRFDEVHFGKFASYYLRRTYYFDVHPPLGKLLLAAAGYLVGYDGHFLFDNIGDDYIKNNVPYVAMRVLPATAGALVAPFAFLTMKEMGVSISGAIFAAVLITFGKSHFLFSSKKIFSILLPLIFSLQKKRTQ